MHRGSGEASRGAQLRALGAGWLGTWQEVVRSRSPLADVLAGLTVAAVALPLNLALAVACDLPPITGLIAGAVGGGVAAVFGGAKLQVTGPAAALQLMVLGLSKEFGAEGVAAAAIVAGVVQLALGFALAGKAARFIPESVLAGFTTGVGVKLFDSQLPEVLGFDYRVVELAQMMHRPKWLHEVSWLAVVCGLFVVFLVTSTSKYKRFPAAIVAIAFITFVSVYVGWDLKRVGEIPSRFPPPALPILDDDRWLDLLTKAVPLGLLAAIESLISASAVDRMLGKPNQHDPNLELLGQGLGNVASGVMGGMPVSGVIVRSGVNVQSGGRTRLASLVHALALAAVVLALGRHLARVPLAALAGLLCVVGYRLVEGKTLWHLAQTEKMEAAAFLVTAAGTVSGHLVLGLVAGLGIHAVHQWLTRHARAERAQLEHRRERGVRAVLGGERADARRPDHHAPPPERHRWLAHIRERAQVARSAFVHGKASVIGRVILGEHVHIAAGSSVRADEGSPFFIGANSNVQDGVVIHALRDKRVVVAGEEWAVYVGKNVSIAHDALVHGPCYVGDGSFIGFKAVVHDAIVGAHCFVGIGAVVVGVEVPDGRFVPHGRIVDTADAVDALPLVSDVHAEFNEEVVEVNRGLAAAYNAASTRDALRARVRRSGEAQRAEQGPRAAAGDPRWLPASFGEKF